MKGKLTLIGMGLWDELDMSLRGLEELKECDAAFAERYTHFGSKGTIENLEKLSGKKITLLSREDVEGEKKILDEAKAKRVALLVGGDPMISTTHISLVLSARKLGIATTTVHASSVFTAAIGESGLQVYKFGKSVTLPFWRENYKPTSTYEVIAENRKRGLHTLVFLDIAEKMMDAREALELLMKLEELKKEKMTGPKEFAVVLGRLGGPGQKIIYGKIKELAGRELGGTPCILIIPGKLHFLEEEALERFKSQ